jgi:tetratricopeptide (TPR) repeat protein
VPGAARAGYALRSVADYSLADVARIFDLSPARLRYWQRTELIPTVPGDASQPAFGFRDLVCIRAVMALLERGVPVRRIRRSVASIRERLPEIERPLGSLRVWVDGSDRVVVRHEGTLMEPDGQLVLDLALAPQEREDVLPLRAPGAPPEERDPIAALEWFEIGCRLDADPARQEEAAGAYQRALASDPDFADAHCNLGALYQQRGERAGARSCYEAAVGADPLHVEARFNLAGLLEEDGRDEAALVHYRAAARSDPTFPDAQLNLALLYDRLGLARRAREHWRRYLGLRPEGSWAELARKRLEGDQSPGS